MRARLALSSTQKLPRTSRLAPHNSEVLPQIHARVQRGHLIVAVEHKRGTLQEFTQAPFFSLTPARMIYIRVHIAVEAVLLGGGPVPGVDRLAVGKANPNKGLGALEAILPWHYDAQRSAVLVGQHFAVHAETQQRQWMHALVHAQALDIRPVEHVAALAGHLFRVQNGRELDEL